MTMTNEEIVRHYRQAADKAADIKVLADLNTTSKNEIIGILEDAGEALPGKRRAGRFDGKIKPLYEQGLNDAEIAEQVGCTSTTVADWRKRNGLPARRDHNRKEADKQIPEVYMRLEAVLTALPKDSSEFVRRSAVGLLCGMFEEYLNRRLKLETNHDG